LVVYPEENEGSSDHHEFVDRLLDALQFSWVDFLVNGYHSDVDGPVGEYGYWVLHHPLVGVFESIEQNGEEVRAEEDQGSCSEYSELYFLHRGYIEEPFAVFRHGVYWPSLSFKNDICIIVV